jgi:DNA repair ATPase RecN
MTAMQRVQSELQRSKKELTERESIVQLLSANEGELSELNFQQKQMTQKIEVDKARVERLRVALEQKRQMWEKKNFELDEIIRTVQVEKSENLREAAEREKVCKELEKKIENLNLEHRARVLKMQEEKESLSRIADTYMHSISQSLGIAV